MTSTDLELTIDLTVKQGKGSELRSLFQTTAPRIQKDEPGTTQWRLAIDAAGQRAVAFDRYASPKDFVTHFHTAQTSGFLEKFMALVDIKQVTVVGDVDGEAKQILDGLGSAYFNQVAGFDRAREQITTTR